jgi:ubiquinone/menaquinone biosynthesis C-methylase UbiE
MKEDWDTWYAKGAHWELSQHPSKTVDLISPELNKDDKVLDLGCGSGRDCFFLAKKGVKVTGIDISKVAIEKAKEFAKKENLDIQFDVGNIEELPYESNFFDKIISAYTIQDTDIEKVSKEMHRVLKNNGKAYLLIILIKEFLETKERTTDFDKDYVLNFFSKYFDIIKEEVIEKIDEAGEDEPAHFHRNLALVLKKK